MTNCVELWKQEGTKDGWSERASSLTWKSFKHVEDVFSLGSWKREVSLRCSAKPMPKRLRSDWQQCCVSIGSLQVDVSHGKVST